MGARELNIVVMLAVHNGGLDKLFAFRNPTLAFLLEREMAWSGMEF
jgi:hypothetical protein